MRNWAERNKVCRRAITLLTAFVVVTIGGVLSASEIETGDGIELDSCRVLDVPYDSVPVDSNFREIINDAFGPGEYLKFDLKYSFITPGYAEMSVDSVFDYNGRLCYSITTRASSYGFFDKVFKVRDSGLTYMDVWGLFPWRFEKHLREGGYTANVHQEFDQYRGLAFEKEDTVLVHRYIQDVLSSLYYVRTLDLEVGDTVHVVNYNDRECYNLAVIVHGREEIDVEAGTFDCLKVEPLLKSAGLFKHEGRLTVWLTDDRLKMPVLMKSKVIVGHLAAELTEFRLGELVY